MRSIEGKLTPLLEKSLKGKSIAGSVAFSVSSFRELVEHAAHLAYLNKDHLLFYRGQSQDYLNKAGNSTLYPSIYRGDYLPQAELNHRFDLLAGASRKLVEGFKNAKVDGSSELSRKRYIQWSILQHYEVCATPLLDLTHSLRVACSFAQLNNDTGPAFVFVLGLPYITNRISIHSEHDIVNVRLLSICPPQALRPYFQEGYVAGTDDITNSFDNKSELDFNNRLIAKFTIPDTKSFWGRDFAAIPRNALYPVNDKVLQICDQIKEGVKGELQPGQLGEFLKSWSEFESTLFKLAAVEQRNITLREAIRRLYSDKLIDENSLSRLDSLRRFRNELVQSPKEISPAALKNNAQVLAELNLIVSRIRRKQPV